MKIQKTKENFFVKKTFQKFFMPAILSSLWLALGGIADCVFVGNGVGSEGLAAVSLGMPVYLFYNILSLGMSIGGSIQFSSYTARGEFEKGNQVFNTIWKGLLLIYIVTAGLGIVFLPQLMQFLGAEVTDAVTAEYIRTQLICVPVMFLQGPLYYFIHNDDAPKLAALSLTISNITDIILNYILVVQLELGVKGSVYATVGGAVVLITISIIHINRKKGVLAFKKGSIQLNILGEAMKTGFATSVQYLYQFITIILVNNILMGMAGKDGVAAFDVIYNLSLLFTAVADAVALTIEPMISSYRSERNTSNIKSTLVETTGYTAFLGGILAVACWIGTEWLVVLFGLDTAKQQLYGAAGIRIYLVSVGFMYANSILSYFYQCMEKEKYAFFITTMRSLIFYVCGLWIFKNGAVTVLWLHFIFAELFTLILWLVIAFVKKDLLGLKEIDTGNVKAFFIDSKDTDISAVIQEIEEFAQTREVSVKQTYYLSLVIEEICCAVFEHCKSESEQIYIQITVVIEEDYCELYIRDNALAFNPFSLESQENVELMDKDMDALGMEIVKKKAKEFSYRRYIGFNTLVVKV